MNVFGSATMTFIDPLDPVSLELPVDSMRSMAFAAVARVLDHLGRVGEQHAAGLSAADLAPMHAAPPEEPTPLESFLDDFFDEWVPRALTTNGPGYLAYIPGGGVFPAAIADLLSNTTNRFTGAGFAAPPLVALEANVLEWFRDGMLFPETTRGVFTTGGSMANFNAILCARERHLGAEIRRGVLYTSTQAHHSVKKSARLAGIMGDRVRAIAVDETFRLRPDLLVHAIAEDRKAGLLPFAVVSNAGTTNTGAVDPLDAIADVARDEAIWHHVDGAYGAFFHLCPELRSLLSGLSRADSVTLDPHKGLFLPYGTGALLVRDGRALRAVHSESAEYFPERGDEYDPSQYGPDLSRGFPGLRVWLTVHTFGMKRIRAAIADKRALACSAAARIAALPGIVMLAPPQLSLFAFYLEGPSLEEENRMTRALLERVAERGRVYLTGCSTGGRFLARVCVMSFRTRQASMDACVEDVAEAARIARATR